MTMTRRHETLTDPEHGNGKRERPYRCLRIFTHTFTRYTLHVRVFSLLSTRPHTYGSLHIRVYPLTLNPTNYQCNTLGPNGHPKVRKTWLHGSLYFLLAFLLLPHWRIRLGTGSAESLWPVTEYSVHRRATIFLD